MFSIIVSLCMCVVISILTGVYSIAYMLVIATSAIRNGIVFIMAYVGKSNLILTLYK